MVAYGFEAVWGLSDTTAYELLLVLWLFVERIPSSDTGRTSGCTVPGEAWQKKKTGPL